MNKILFANGCSHSYGAMSVPTPDPIAYINNSVSAFLAKSLGYDLVNHAQIGGSNARIVRTTKKYCNNYIKEHNNVDDLFVLIGWTELQRYEISLPNSQLIQNSLDVFKIAPDLMSLWFGVSGNTEYANSYIVNKLVLPAYIVDYPVQFFVKKFIENHNYPIDTYFDKNILQIVPRGLQEYDFHYSYLGNSDLCKDDMSKIVEAANTAFSTFKTKAQHIFELQSYLENHNIKYLFYDAMTEELQQQNTKAMWDDIKDPSWPDLEFNQGINFLSQYIQDELYKQYPLLYASIAKSFDTWSTYDHPCFFKYNMEKYLISNGFQFNETRHFNSDANEFFADTLLAYVNNHILE